MCLKLFKTNLKMVAQAGTSGTNLINVLYINDLRRARNAKVSGTSWHKLAQEVIAAEPQRRGPWIVTRGPCIRLACSRHTTMRS